MTAEFPPTAEQLAALDLFSSGESLVIEAGAGTGKTSTLKLLAASTNRKGQYVAFNKAIVVEAGETMPGNVSCNTAHSLAFRTTGKKYAGRLNSGRMRSEDIARRIGVERLTIEVEGARKVLSAGYLAGLAMRSVVKFCQTADERPTRYHVPWVDGIDPMPIATRPRSRENNKAVAQHIEASIVRAWEDLSRYEGALPFRHDHYLKLWQLSDPTIYADFIMFDEAQDANPVMAAVVAAQTHAQLVWVGDSQQQIYSFTGAVNAMADMDADHRTFLTQSFRFGPAIAEVANDLLGMLGADLTLIGTDTIESVVEDVDDPSVILTRTNAEAVRSVLGAVKRGQTVHLVGGGGEILAFAKAAAILMDGRKVDHPELACFDSWDEVRQYVQLDEQGGELRLLVNLIDDFGVATILEALDGMTPEKQADLIVSTAHKSKGRQWSAVQLGGDFPEEIKGKEELRLLYVAVTRAQHRLDVSNVSLLRDLAEEPVTS